MSRHQILALLTDAETAVAIEDIMQDAVVIVTVKLQIHALPMVAVTVHVILDIEQAVVETAMDRAQQLVQLIIAEIALAIVVMEHVLL